MNQNLILRPDMRDISTGHSQFEAYISLPSLGLDAANENNNNNQQARLMFASGRLLLLYKEPVLAFFLHSLRGMQ
jgi:hypothetical protein